MRSAWFAGLGDFFISFFVSLALLKDTNTQIPFGGIILYFLGVSFSKSTVSRFCCSFEGGVCSDLWSFRGKSCCGCFLGWCGCFEGVMHLMIRLLL